MSKVNFVLNSKGVRELLKSTEAQAICMEYANEVANRASAHSDGYIVEKRNYPERAGAAVRADSLKARLDNSKNNTLLKSLGGGR